MDIFERIRKDEGGPLGQYRRKAHGYYMFPKLEGPIEPYMTFQGKQVLAWTFNNYLGLADHPAVREAAADAAMRWGAGSGGSRLVSGTMTVHRKLEERLAEFEDRDDLWRDLQWTPQAETNTLAAARLRATIRNAPGVLGQACTIIGEAGANILNLKMAHRQADFFDVDFDVEVVDARHLTHIAAALRACPSVETVDRVKG